MTRNAPEITAKAVKVYVRECRECGGTFEAQKVNAAFCALTCKNAFHARKRRRGAELYDAVMTHAHDRKHPLRNEMWSLIGRLASIYREEDRKERGGRESWEDIRVLLDANPWIRAEYLQKSAKSK